MFGFSRTGFSHKFTWKISGKPSRSVRCCLARTYQALSSASRDDLWQKLTDLTDVSWHPLLASTNVPRGLVAKPGLIYEAVTRLIPIPIQIFVEQVWPGELLSVRILVLPGLEEQVTYEVKSSVCGTYVSYSVTLRGWLSPLAWSLLRPHAASVAARLVQATEQAALQAVSGQLKPSKHSCLDF
ncbi:MAG TPA: SRPBCC family protein [Thermosynechococcaceae cyanobacterium]